MTVTVLYLALFCVVSGTFLGARPQPHVFKEKERSGELQISRKAQAMPYSAIRKFVPFAEEAKKKGIKIYHLNIGQPDVLSPPSSIEEVKNINLKLVEYPNSQGIPQFLEGLVKYYASIGIQLQKNNFLVTNGGSEALQIAFSVAFNPEDEVIVFEPFYTNYNAFALQNDVVFRPVTTTIDSGFALPPMEQLEKYITPRTRGILICNPSNPTGALYTKESLLQLAQIVKKYNLYLFSDEVYREFCYTDEPHFSVLSIKDIEQNVIVIDSVSKRYSLCGARVGYVVSRNEAFMANVMKYAQARLCSPALGQIAAVGALKAGPDYFQAVKEEYQARRDTLVRGLQAIPGVKCPLPMGAFYAAVELPIDDAEKFTKWLLTEFQYEKQTVMVAPLGGFYATPGLGKNQIRVAYVLKIEDLKNAVKCLEVALQQYPGRTLK